MKSLFSARTFLCSLQTKPVTKTGFNLVPNFMIKNSQLALNYFSRFISCINFGHFLLLHPSAAALFLRCCSLRNCTHRFYLLAAQENLIRAERKAKHERIIISRFDDFCEGHSRRVSRVFVSECTFQHFIYSRPTSVPAHTDIFSFSFGPKISFMFFNFCAIRPERRLRCCQMSEKSDPSHSA